jgi:hypothetical protein
MATAQTPFADMRERDCFVEMRALEMWLGFLTPLRWFTVIGSVILSALAGATILGSQQLLGDTFPKFAGVCALLASILTTLHATLHCDTHQAECRRLIQIYQSLYEGFKGAMSEDDATRKAKERDLEKEFETAIRDAKAAAPPRYKRAARKEPYS